MSVTTGGEGTSRTAPFAGAGGAAGGQTLLCPLSLPSLADGVSVITGGEGKRRTARFAGAGGDERPRHGSTPAPREPCGSAGSRLPGAAERDRHRAGRDFPARRAGAAGGADTWPRPGGGGREPAAAAM